MDTLRKWSCIEKTHPNNAAMYSGSSERIKFQSLFLVVFGLSVFGWTGSAHAGTLENVRAQKNVRCGVFPDDPGRSAIDKSGVWSGFYVDFCRALAAAVLGNPEFVTYVEVGPESRFTSLRDKRTDVVMYSTTWTLGRESKYDVAFPAIYLFDGQGFMVRKSAGIQKLEDLDGKTVCVTENTTTHSNLKDLIDRKQLRIKVVNSNGDAFFRGTCDAYTADAMNLATNRAHRADNPTAYEILPDRVSREPIGPMVRNDDKQWEHVVRLVVNALILAEEHDVTRKNIDQVSRQKNSTEVENLLGTSPTIGKMLGLDPLWAVRAIRAVGNYGEIFNRHYGPGTPIGMERGYNQLWSKGGLLYAPLFK